MLKNRELITKFEPRNPGWRTTQRDKEYEEESSPSLAKDCSITEHSLRVGLLRIFLYYNKLKECALGWHSPCSKSAHTLLGWRSKRNRLLEQRLLEVIDIHSHILPGIDDGSDSLGVKPS